MANHQTKNAINSGADCIFCKIRDGVIPAPKVYEDDKYFCIRDIQPQAKHHFLVIPKEHIATLSDAFSENADDPVRRELMGGLFEVAAKMAAKEGIAGTGFRCVMNTNLHAGQTVFHIHLHVLGGEALRGGLA